MHPMDIKRSIESISIESIEPEGPSEGLPFGLRNLRRIWALVDDLLDAVIDNQKEIE